MNIEMETKKSTIDRRDEENEYFDKWLLLYIILQCSIRSLVSIFHGKILIIIKVPPTIVRMNGKKQKSKN